MDSSELRDPVQTIMTLSFFPSCCVHLPILGWTVFIEAKLTDWIYLFLEKRNLQRRWQSGSVWFRDDDGPSYFPARVEKVIHNSYYLVKYESLNARPNGDLNEILDPQYLRPVVDFIPGTNRFMVGSHVEVFHQGGWSPGVVLTGLSGSNYAVTVESKGEPITVHFNVSNVRLRLDWNGRMWSKWDSPSKVPPHLLLGLPSVTALFHFVFCSFNLSSLCFFLFMLILVFYIVL